MVESRRFICHNLHSFKERVILLYLSILQTRQMSHLLSSAVFTIPLKAFIKPLDAPQKSMEIKILK